MYTYHTFEFMTSFLKKNTEGPIKNHNPEKLVIQVTQDDENQSTNTTQYLSDTAMRKQTQHNICRTPLYVNKHNAISVGHRYT